MKQLNEGSSWKDDIDPEANCILKGISTHTKNLEDDTVKGEWIALFQKVDQVLV